MARSAKKGRRDAEDAEDAEACVVARSAKKGRRELMVAGALAFGEIRRKKRLRDTEGIWELLLLALFLLTSVLRVKRKQ